MGALGAAITLGIITQNDTFKDNLDQALLLGVGVGAVVGNGMHFFPNYLDKQVYGRLYLLPSPIEYAQAFPGDILSGTLLIGSRFFCDGRELSRLGGESCGF